MKIQKCTFFFKRVPMESHHCRIQCNSKTVVTSNCGCQMPPYLRQFPNLSTQPPPGALLQLCTQGLFIPQPPVLFSGQEIRKPRLTEMPLLVRKSLIYSRNLEVHFFTINSTSFTHSPDVPRSVIKTHFSPRLNQQTVLKPSSSVKTFK